MEITIPDAIRKEITSKINHMDKEPLKITVFDAAIDVLLNSFYEKSFLPFVEKA